jgi:hypothetical protein
LFSAQLVTVRPLNILFVFLFVGTALCMEWRKVPRIRAVGVALLTGGVGLVVGGMDLAQSNSDQVTSENMLTALAAAPLLLFNVHSNTLINPYVTPVIVLVLSGLGTWKLYKRDKGVVFYLLFWIASFFIAHAIIIPEAVEMQARYHLHLVVPFAMLAGASWLYFERVNPRWLVAAGAGVLISPFLHLGFIQNVNFNESNEHRFTEQLSDVIPDQCVVIEPIYGEGQHSSSRIKRMSTLVSNGEKVERLEVATIYVDPSSPNRAVELVKDLVDGSDKCFYYYEGMACSEMSFDTFSDCHSLRKALTTLRLTNVTFSNNEFNRGGYQDSTHTLSLYRVTGIRGEEGLGRIHTRRRNASN